MNVLSESGKNLFAEPYGKGAWCHRFCLPLVTTTYAVPVTFATLLEDCAKTQPFTSIWEDTV